jgi:hypothetical protein
LDKFCDHDIKDYICLKFTLPFLQQGTKYKLYTGNWLFKHDIEFKCYEMSKLFDEQLER